MSAAPRPSDRCAYSGGDVPPSRCPAFQPKRAPAFEVPAGQQVPARIRACRYARMTLTAGGAPEWRCALGDPPRRRAWARMLAEERTAPRPSPART